MDIAVSHEAINGMERPVERELRLIHPNDLQAVWPLVRSGIEKVCERGSDGWIVEDVYMGIKQGVSLLYVAYVHQYYVGFAVLTPTIGWAGPQVHLWLLYNRGERDVLDTFLPDLIDIVRARGATKLTMSSPRKGWEKRAVQLGFHPTLQHYVMEV